MDVKEIKKRIAARVKYLAAQQGKDDPAMSDRDWDMEQEALSARINELTKLLVEIDREG
jgi:hypothetical protein